MYITNRKHFRDAYYVNLDKCQVFCSDTALMQDPWSWLDDFIVPNPELIAVGRHGGQVHMWRRLVHKHSAIVLLIQRNVIKKNIYIRKYFL